MTSTVTPKIVTYQQSNEDRISNMEFVKLLPTESEKRNVTHFDKTISIKVLPLAVFENRTSFADESQISDNEEDGVFVTDDDDDDEGEENFLDEDSFEDDDDEDDDSEILKATTTTKKPTKRISQQSSRRPQRRMHKTTTSEKSKQQESQNSLSLAHFMSFLKKIQNSFATRTAKTISDKILILKKFRDSLIRSINRQIESLWRFNRSTYPNKKSPNLRPEHKRRKSHRIQKRTLSTGHDDGWMESGGMAFPSAEGALLSISFLTFAVFLIKLVLVIC
jgi:hypothetical protein